MTGLEKILEEIKSESDKKTEEILSSARSEAELMEQAAQEEGKKLSADILSKAQKQYEEILARGKSSAELEKHKTMLEAKQQVITEMLHNALNEMKCLPEEAYFSLLLQLVEKHSLPQMGEIRFSEKDISRLPKHFEKKINAVSKGTLLLSDTAANIDSGFILIYGGIEENCSFEAMFRSKHEELTDEISRLLFAH